MSQFKYAKNASKLHKTVGEGLSQGIFKEMTCLQEVQVSKLFPEYGNNRDRYDWIVKELNLVIEAHGSQHYKVATFGMDAEKAVMAFQSQKYRDEKKKEIALLNGWTYLEVPYTDLKKIDYEYILDKYNQHFNETPLSPKEEASKSNRYSRDDRKYRDKLKAKRREANKRRYRQAKEWKRKMENKSK